VAAGEQAPRNVPWTRRRAELGANDAWSLDISAVWSLDFWQHGAQGGACVPTLRTQAPVFGPPHFSSSHFRSLDLSSAFSLSTMASPATSPSSLPVDCPLVSPDVPLPVPVQSKVYPCKHCGKPYSSPSNRSKHVKAAHADKLNPGLGCSFCPQRFADGQQLQLHTRLCGGLQNTTAPSSVASSAPISDAEAKLEDDIDSPVGSTSLLKPVGTMLCNEALDAAMKPFLNWLGEAPVYEMENTLKGSLLLSESQLRQPRNDLRFLLNAAGTTQLSVLVQPDVVKRLLNGLQFTGKGPARVFQLCLMLRKVLVFLFSQQSKATSSTISPAQHSAWGLLSRSSHDASKKRKLRQRDKMAFGDDEDEIMTQEEMTLLQNGCLRAMDKVEELTEARFTRPDAERWQKFFINILFLTVIGPRSETMAAWSTKTVLPPSAVGNNSDTQYLVRISAEENKAGQPVYLHIPELLTRRMKVLFIRVLPKDYEGALFLTRSGKARTDFTDTTRPVCTMFLGRPINPHKFRTSLATALYERSDVDDALLRGAADHMTHSTQVQRAFYARQKRLKTGAALQRIIMEGVVDTSRGCSDRAADVLDIVSE
jgi:hypothetical protein